MTDTLALQERGHLTTHLFILGCIVTLSAGVYFFPGWVLLHGPGCVLKTFLHLNCPFCGMTRDFVCILHGQKHYLNPFSGIAAVVVYLVYPAFFLWAWKHGRLALFYQPAMHKLIVASLLIMFMVNNLSH